MFDWGLNGLWMYFVFVDVCWLMYKVKYVQGVDIICIFCGLNEVRNIIFFIYYVFEGGMILQVILCIIFLLVYIVEYYMVIVDKLIEVGVFEICLKDMVGVGCFVMLG